MTVSRNATVLLEQGLRVLAQQVMQDDPERRERVIRGLALAARDKAREERDD